MVDEDVEGDTYILCTYFFEVTILFMIKSTLIYIFLYYIYEI